MSLTFIVGNSKISPNRYAVFSKSKVNVQKKIEPKEFQEALPTGCSRLLHMLPFTKKPKN